MKIFLSQKTAWLSSKIWYSADNFTLAMSFKIDRLAAKSIFINTPPNILHFIISIYHEQSI